MADKTFQRRLAAILAADVVGYSRLMQVRDLGRLVCEIRLDVGWQPTERFAHRNLEGGLIDIGRRAP